MRICPRCHGRYGDESRFCPRDGAPLPAPDGDPRIGTVLYGQFELLEVCGKGAMGTVYRAWQNGMDRQVAVKVLRSELLRDPAVVKRFHREARAVARIQHPNIVTVFLVGETDDKIPYIVMEYVDGEVLADVLARDGTLDPARAIRIARQITSALADAHAEGIVHRDLKPANILLTQRRRAADFVKILDFGIAKILRGEVAPGQLGAESHLTRDGTIFGTPHYIAPEQASGADVDHRADLYSVGVILYRMLTGQLPFDGAGIAVLLAHINQTPPRPRDLRPDLDPALEALVLRALAKDPAARFQSAEELSDALDTASLRLPTASLSWATWTAGPTPGGRARTPTPPPAAPPILVAPPTAKTISSAPAAPAAVPAVTVKGVAVSRSELGEEPAATAVDPSSGPPRSLVGALAAVADALPPPRPVPPPELAAGISGNGLVARELEERAAPGFEPDLSSSYDAWRPPPSRARTALIAAVVAVLCAGLAVIGAYVLGRSSGAKAEKDPAPATPAPAVAVAPDAAPPAPAPAPPPPSPPRAVEPVAWRVVTLGEGGYSIRVLLPPEVRAGLDHDLAFEVWAPDGRPVVAPALRITLEEPGGVERALDVPATATTGRYSMRRRFPVAGEYHVHIQPSGREEPHVWFDFEVLQPDGSSVRRGGRDDHRHKPRRGTAPRVEPVRPADAPLPPPTESPPPPPADPPADEDPYTIIDDKPPGDPPPPPPPDPQPGDELE